MNDAPYVPTHLKIVEAMLDLASVRAGEVLVDLGCGDGRVCHAAARRGMKAIGYDREPRWTQVTIGVQFFESDMYGVDLSGADVVYFYLNGSCVRLLPQLRRMKAGSRVLSLDFQLGPPYQDSWTTHCEGRERTVYLWRPPLGGE